MKSKKLYPICVSLSEKNAGKTVSSGRKFPFVEVRLDLGDFKAADCREIFSSLKNAIATCRKGKLNVSTRRTLMEAAIEAGARFIDLDLQEPAELKKVLIEKARKKGAKVIVSYHNFRATPSIPKLKEVIKKANAYKPDYIKIATHIESDADTLNLLVMLTEKNNLITVGMGNKGRLLRMIAPYLGSCFTFASAKDGAETAPGQVSYKDLSRLYRQVENLRR